MTTLATGTRIFPGSLGFRNDKLDNENCLASIATNLSTKS
jgi:hypothetical protein